MFSKGIRYPHRRVLAAAAALALLAAPVIGQVHQASAFESWCWDDPVINLNGKLVNIDVGVNALATTVAKNVHYVTITVDIPSGLPHSVVAYQANPYLVEKVVFTSSQGEQYERGNNYNVAVGVKFLRAGTELPAGVRVKAGAANYFQDGATTDYYTTDLVLQ